MPLYLLRNHCCFTGLHEFRRGACVVSRIHSPMAINSAARIQKATRIQSPVRIHKAIYVHLRKHSCTTHVHLTTETLIYLHDGAFQSVVSWQPYRGGVTCEPTCPLRQAGRSGASVPGDQLASAITTHRFMTPRVPLHTADSCLSLAQYVNKHTFNLECQITEGYNSAEALLLNSPIRDYSLCDLLEYSI